MARRKVKEIPAKGTIGFLLTSIEYADNGLGLVFRVYNKKNKRRFKDYRIDAMDIKMKIVDKDVAFKGHRLDWNDRLLGIIKNI